MSIFQSIGRTASNIYQGIKRIALTPVKVPLGLTPKNVFREAVTLTALPIGTAGKGIKFVSKGISKGYSSVANLIRKETKSPVITQGISKGLGTIGKKALGFGTAGVLGGLGYGVSKLAISGEPITPASVLRTGLTGVGVGLSKVGGVLGIASGTAENIIKETSALKVPPINVTPPNTTPFMNFPDFSGLTTPIINMSMPSGVPTMVNTPAFSPSISTGGGMDYTPLILALLGGGALLGYGLSRRRKKKRFKKKKKHK